MDVLNNDALDLLARFITGLAGTPPTLELHLFVAPWNMAPDTTAANLVECSAPGYAAIPLTPANWVGSTVNGVATYTYPVLPFTFTGQGSPAQTIYGHWIGDSATGNVLWGQTWLSPYAIPSGGSTIYLAPTWANQSCPPPCSC